MLPQKRGVTKSVSALVVIVIIVAAVGAYGWVANPIGPTSTVTATGTGSTVTVTGTGSTVTVTSTATTAASLDSLINGLIAKAKTESSMIVCAPTNPSDFGKYINYFYAAFPWAQGKVTELSIGTSACESRIVSEQKAGQVTISLWYGDKAEGYTLAAQGVTVNQTSLAQYMPMLGYTNATYDPQGLWFPTTVDPTGIFCNTNVVPNCPTTLQGLTDSSLSGKITIQDPALVSIVGDSFAYLEPSMGNASWTALMKGIAANKPTLTSDAGTALTNVATGEFGVSYSELHDALGALPKYPVKFIWANPTPASEQGEGFLKNAPAPALAALWMLAEASPLGQYSVFNFHSTVPANPVYAGYYAKIPANVTLIASAPPGFYSHLDFWRAVFTNIFHSSG